MYTLKILKTNYITHDVKRIVLKKPEDNDFSYTPGQAAHLSVNKSGWTDKKRPFTFTSLQSWPEIEFTIKIYDDRKSVTHEIGKLEPGDEMIIHDIFDTIKYKGPGIFLAGGTGITPFIAIFRALKASNNLRNVALIYSNKTQNDIIYARELHELLGNAFLNVFTRQGVIGFRERHIDRDFLIQNIGEFNLNFYVCGPQEFTQKLTKDLISLGAKPDSITF